MGSRQYMLNQAGLTSERMFEKIAKEVGELHD